VRTQTDDRVVRRYLDDLERALVGVPAARRRELVADIRAHIAAAREEEPDVPVEQVLDRLGSPADLAEMRRSGSALPELARPSSTIWRWRCC
jgi:uncharacterized membrane protein